MDDKENRVQKDLDDGDADDDEQAPNTSMEEEAVKSGEDPSLQGSGVTSGASWGSWFQSAKEKTYTTLELVKKDLSELGDVVATEASVLASTTVESVRQQAQNLQQIMSFEDEDTGPQEEHQQKDVTAKDAAANEVEGSSSTYSLGWAPKLPSVPPSIRNSAWMKTIVDTVRNITQENAVASKTAADICPRPEVARRSDLQHHILYGIQTDRETYTAPPEGDEKLYTMWREEFKLSEHDGEISALLATCPPMRALYQQLVPAEIENAVFWERYFYKVHQAELLARYRADADRQLLRAETGKDTTAHFDGSDGADSLTVDVNSTECLNSPSRRSNTDESWSICSSTHVELQELNGESNDGPQTPKADSTNLSDRSDGWVNWDE